MKVTRYFLTPILLVLSLSAGYAHEVRPAYLGITQINDSVYQVLWKIPALGDKVPKIHPQFPEYWDMSKRDAQLMAGAVKHQWEFTSLNPLNGQKIFVEGLSATMIDVLLNIELLNGEQYSQIIKANEPFYVIPETSSFWEVSITYLKLGIDHILLGIDHLMFVLALIFVTNGKWKIVKTVTAFTIAHSITLSLAALGFVRFPVPPVEAVIALSIIFLAKEIIQHEKGKDSLTYRYPWIVAFTFGLLHGFGFASALTETGLPQSDIPAALAFFNIGVEVGQIAFVIVVLFITQIVNATKINWPVWIQKAPTYLIGSMASYWFIDRVVGYW